MNLLGSLLLFMGGLVLILVVSTIVRVVTRGRGGFVASLIPVVIIVLIVAGGSFYLDHNGTIVQGTVESKHEDVLTYDTGIYQRSLFITVQFSTNASVYGSSVNMNVDSTLFDQLHTGQTVPVRYINPAGLFLYSRLAQQDTLSSLAVEFPWQTYGPVILFLCLVGIIFLGFAPRRRRRPQAVEPGMESASDEIPPAGFRKIIALILFLIWLVVGFLTVFQPVLTAMSTTSWQTTTAQVKVARRYTEVTQSLRTSRSIPLLQDFDIVQFTFTPQGSTEPVTGVDVVDSTRDFPQQGSPITIQYAPDNPRVDEIPGATYTHYWKNPLGGFGLFLAVILVLGLLGLLVRLGWRVLTGGITGALVRR